jgi:protein-S-isoprenylcysteine O-methyltransferase Ste14
MPQDIDQALTGARKTPEAVWKPVKRSEGRGSGNPADHPNESAPENASLAQRLAGFTYGTVCYAIFFGTFLYAIGWIGNVLVPKSIDSTPQVPLGQALFVNILLLGMFAVQHSVMARQGFKRWWTRFVPEPVERSTYVLLSSLALLLLFWQWQPMGGVVWDVQNPIGRAVLHSAFSFGWLLVLATTFLINHFDLFGLRQVWFYARNRQYQPLGFATPGPYRWVRHPLYVGWLFAFWATPTMTLAHLLFAIAITAYILVAIQLEERDLVNIHGRAYAEYRRRIPMLVPSLFRSTRR